jgi:predicted MFS family arabinose efflux permease
MLQTYNDLHPETTFNIPILSFLIIGIGGLACVLSGYLSQTFGAKRIAFTSLFCLARLVFPFLFAFQSATLFLAFLLFWEWSLLLILHFIYISRSECSSRNKRNYAYNCE